MARIKAIPEPCTRLPFRDVTNGHIQEVGHMWDIWKLSNKKLP